MEMFVSSLLVATLAVACLGDDTLNIHRGVIVHLFEWKYSDIAQECEEFLSPQGFAGIQISPPSENIVLENRPWYERYQPVSYQLTTRSGTEQELRDMLTRCNKVRVRVFADVVFNHMTAAESICGGTGGSECDAKAFSYPAVPYTREHFHPVCEVKDYNNAYQVRNCEVKGLHDLDQSQEFVREKILGFLNHLIDIGFAGFRIDAAKHMDPSDLQDIYSQLKSLSIKHGFPKKTKPLIYQEVIYLGGEAITPQEYISLGLVTEFKHGKELGHAFQGHNDLKWLIDFGPAWNLLPDDKAVVFIENHDTERGKDKDILNYKTSRAYKMAVSFMLASGYGTPKILSSYGFSHFDEGPPTQSPRPINGNICSNGWICQHRWRQIFNMVKFHNVARGTKVTYFWDNGKNQIAFCRGKKAFIAFNLEAFPLDQTLDTCLPKGSYCDVISGDLINGQCSGKTVIVGKDGKAQITVGAFDPNSPDDGVLALHVKASFGTNPLSWVGQLNTPFSFSSLNNFLFEKVKRSLF